MKRKLLAALTVLILASLVGCGGNSDTKYIKGKLSGADGAGSAEGPGMEKNKVTSERKLSAGYSDNSGTQSNSDLAVNQTGSSMDQPAIAAGFSMNDKSKVDGVGNVAKTDARANAKIIINGSLEMECLNYDDTITKIQKYVTDKKGYISASDIQGISIVDRGNGTTTRTASMTIRIPKGEHESFIAGLKDFGQITVQRLGSEDITGQYFDTDARVNSLKAQEQRLLELYKKAEKIPDIITVEDKLREVREQIESLSGQIKRWDNQVDYATVNLAIREVKKYQEVLKLQDSFGTKLISNLKSALINLSNIMQNLILLIAYLLPFLGLFAIVIIPTRFIIRRVKKSREDKLK